MDLLRVEGLGRNVDGEYECDFAGLLMIGSEERLTVREANFVRDFSGARGGEVIEAFLARDEAVVSALAMVVLRRKGKPILESTVLDLRSGWATFEPDESEDAEVPPTSEGDTTKTQPNDSGMTSMTPSESLDEDLRVIGVPA